MNQYRGQLAGKIVVDITNPVEFDTMDGLDTPLNSPSAKETAAVVPADYLS